MAARHEQLRVGYMGVPLVLDDAQFGGDALMALAEITGIPVAWLAQARAKMRRSGSLTALRRLLSDQRLQRSEGFSYLLTVEVQQSRTDQPKQHLEQTVRLAVQSRRGRVHLTMTTHLGRSHATSGKERQSARVGAVCTIETPNTCRTFHHQMVMVQLIHPAPRAWASAA